MQDDRMKIVEKMNYKVVKANEIIQKARYDLNLQELKALAYCISMIKPGDDIRTEYEFSVKDYCMLCGLDSKNGGNYQHIKDTLKGLRDKSFWLLQPDGSEVTVGWLAKARVQTGSGRISVQFDSDLQKYIIGLFENFTQYELISTLPMASAYSIRIYELLKSYAYKGGHTFNTGELKRQLGATHYVNFKDFRRKVIEIAVKEINLYTDIEVSWEPVTKGRKVIEVTFHIKQRDTWGRIAAESRARGQIEGQLSLFDMPEGGDDE